MKTHLARVLPKENKRGKTLGSPEKKNKKLVERSIEKSEKENSFS